MIPFDNAALFNATVERFLRTPFVKRDRIKDLVETIGKGAQLLNNPLAEAGHSQVGSSSSA